MTIETRYPCPVCLGVRMEKVRPRSKSTPTLPADTQLVLDHCPRCGGVWFEAGEVQRLRRIDAADLWRLIVRRKGTHTMQCHECNTMFPRSLNECPGCGWNVALDCPVCERTMRISQEGGMRLDFCPRDRGVWFDHDELAGIWKMQIDSLVKRRGSRDIDVGSGVGEVVLLDALLYDPFLMYYGLEAAGYAASGIGHTLASAGSLDAAGGIAGAAGEVAGAAGEVASSLFETIVEIIAGLFG